MGKSGIGRAMGLKSWKLRVFFAWYDLWVGFYYDQKRRTLYFCPLPCVVFMLEMRSKADSSSALPRQKRKTMNKENVLKWIDAMRSREYGQSVIGLRGYWPKQFSALGLACEISGLGHWEGCNYVIDGHKSNDYPPERVINWLGMDHDIVDRCYRMNDLYREHFSSIANYIEELLKDQEKAGVAADQGSADESGKDN
jgi:hypothetical protein